MYKKCFLLFYFCQSNIALQASTQLNLTSSSCIWHRVYIVHRSCQINKHKTVILIKYIQIKLIEIKKYLFTFEKQNNKKGNLWKGNADYNVPH